MPNASDIAKPHVILVSHSCDHRVVVEEATGFRRRGRSDQLNWPAIIASLDNDNAKTIEAVLSRSGSPGHLGDLLENTLSAPRLRMKGDLGECPAISN